MRLTIFLLVFFVATGASAQTRAALLKEVKISSPVVDLTISAVNTVWETSASVARMKTGQVSEFLEASGKTSSFVGDFRIRCHNLYNMSVSVIFSATSAEKPDPKLKLELRKRGLRPVQDVSLGLDWFKKKPSHASELIKMLSQIVVACSPESQPKPSEGYFLSTSLWLGELDDNKYTMTLDEITRSEFEMMK